MKNISKSGTLTEVEHKKNARDALVNMCNVLLTSISAGLYTYLSGDSFTEYIEGFGAYATMIQFIITSYVLPRLNRKYNFHRI